LPDGSYEQYVIDMDRVPKKANPTVPAWVAVVHDNGDITPAPGVLQLPEKFVIVPVVPQLQLWCKAGLILARSKFGDVLEQDRVEATARIHYWLSGGNRSVKGWVDDKLDIDDLPMRILQQWPYWQSDAFKRHVANKRLTLWGARLETINNAGYKLALTENRLKVIYGRMQFRKSEELQKSKKL
jgi:hypothetical protein